MKAVVLGFLMSASLKAVEGSDWMKGLPDTTALSQLSIPGAHDAGARFEPFPGTARCQDLAIAEQLAAGVRFLDIRCRHLKDRFQIHHGMVYQNLDFDGVLADVRGFLKAHPGECVVMSVKEEFTAAENTRSFGETLDSYIAKNPGGWFTGTHLPGLSEVRGRIVLFRRFAGEAKGIQATPWPDNVSFHSGVLAVQDRYHGMTTDAKWAAFEALLAEAATGKPETLYVNFSSGAGTKAGLPNLREISDAMNPRLAAWFAVHPRGHYGIIAMDFANAERCARIYGTNF